MSDTKPTDTPDTLGDLLETHGKPGGGCPKCARLERALSAAEAERDEAREQRDEAQAARDKLLRAVEQDGIALGEDGYYRNWRAERAESALAEARNTIHDMEITVPHSTIAGLNDELRQVKSALAVQRAALIEECAKVCDEQRAAWIGYLNSAGPRCGSATLAGYETSAATASECAKAIRALASAPQDAPHVFRDRGDGLCSTCGHTCGNAEHDDGMVRVPREPTEAMAEAFDGARYWGPDHDHKFATGYAAMLAAAQPPVEG